MPAQRFALSIMVGAFKTQGVWNVRQEGTAAGKTLFLKHSDDTLEFLVCKLVVQVADCIFPCRIHLCGPCIA